MKKNDNSFNGKVITALDKLGLTAGELAVVQDYLDSDPRDESILDAITPRDLYSVPMEDLKPMHDFIDGFRDKRDRNKEDIAALGNIIFAIGLCSGADMFSSTFMHLRLSPAVFFDGLIDDYKIIAMNAEFETVRSITMRGRKLQASEIWQLAAESSPVLDKAAGYCGFCASWPKAYIRMMQYYHRFAAGTDDEAMKAELDLELVPLLVTNFPESIEGLNDADITALKDYILSDAKYDSPLDPGTASICRKASFDTELTCLKRLLFWPCVLLWQHSDILARMIRIFTEIDLASVVSVIAKSFEDGLASERLGGLERKMPFDTETYIRACNNNHNELKDEIKRLYKEYHDEFMRVLETSVGMFSRDMLVSIGKIDREEYSRLTDPDSDFVSGFRQRTARSIADDMPAGGDELYRFLIGTASAPEIMPYLDSYTDAFNAGGLMLQKESAFRQIFRNDPMTLRFDMFLMCVGILYNVVEELKDGTGYNKELKQDALIRLFSALDECGWPRKTQYELVSRIFTACYGDKTKSSFLEQLSQVIAARLDEDESTAAYIPSAPAPVRTAACELYISDPERYRDKLFAMAGDSSKTVSEKVIAALSEHSEWSEDILALLSSKKSAVRETAIEILSRWDASKYADRLQAALAAEKSQKLRERLEEMLGATPAENKTAEKSEDAQPTVDDIIARYIKSGKKRSLDWLFAEPVPGVRRNAGDGADTDALQAVMLAYSTMPKPGVSEDAKLIAAELNNADLEAAARETLARWLDGGADAKKKWVLYFASIHGGDAAAQTIISNINQWPLQSRGAIAAEAVNALALSPAPSALMTVDSLSRKCKFKQVKAAAQKALDFAAEQLGITSEQLADRIVPDLGFDSKMTRVFDYGPRSFTVRLTPALDLIITDQTGKRIKNLPAVGQKDDNELASQSSEQFKLLKKQLKAVIATQKLRLELALSSGRQWTAEAWRQLFVNNPVMRQFAIGLIWGTYDNSKLIDSFRYMEDGSFNTCDEDEYELSESSVIGLVHPIELDKDALEGWKQQLEDYEITQPVEQLGRRVFTLTDEEREADTLDRFGGIMLNGLSLSGKLLGMGWYRGSVEDGGMYYCYYRENIADGVSAVLRFSGSYVGDQDGTVTVYNALFYKAGTVQYGSYVYDDVKPQDRIKLAGITPRCFSETVLQLEKATASGSDKDENWRKDMGARFR